MNQQFRWLRQFFPILIYVCIVTSCQPNRQFSRPVEMWYMRSVLDYQPRMITLFLHEEMNVAYDLAKGTLYKIWKGGVNYDGAAFNNLKTVQPTSWGHTYFVDSLKDTSWEVEVKNQNVQPHVLFKGYTLHNNQLTFQYALVHDGDTIQVMEKPECETINESEVGLVREFTLENVPEGMNIYVQVPQGRTLLIPESTTTVNHVYEKVIQLPPRDPAYENNLTSKGRYWLEKSGCNTCHETDIMTIGPGYQQIAARYEKNEENITQLVQKVVNGGAGSWGEVPMRPHPEYDKGAIKQMISYILSLKPKDESPQPKKPKASEPQIIPVSEEVKPKPGFGASLEGVHPAYDLIRIRKESFRPRVGALAFDEEGNLLVSTWDSLGAVYKLTGVESNDTSQIEIKRIAQGLAEPLGMRVVEGELFVLQKQELTQLIDHDGDEIIDEYRSICNSFDVSTDFHEFSYGLEYKDGYFYANLGLAMRLMEHESQLPDRGRTIRIARNGSFEWVNHGLRQPNGIGKGVDGELFITENQGRWVPSCKVIHVQDGVFHGCRLALKDSLPELKMKAPAVWLPQDEIGNSPGEPVLMQDGPYKGQMLHGEVTHGGIKRVYLEKVGGEYQGCVFRFSQGFEAGINRLRWGPDGGLYVGGVGMNGNWGWGHELRTFGLQKLMYNGQVPFEMLQVSAHPEGLEITFTEALSESSVNLLTQSLIQQWWYLPTTQYGGPKRDVERLTPTGIRFTRDRTRVLLKLPQMKTEHVVYIRLPEQLQSKSGRSLWSSEVWYTLNQIP